MGNRGSLELSEMCYRLKLTEVESFVQKNNINEVDREGRNPINHMGLMNGRAIFYRADSGTVPMSSLPELLLSCDWSPDGRPEFKDMLDPSGRGHIEFDAFLDLYKTHLRKKSRRLVNPEVEGKELEDLKAKFYKLGIRAYILKRHPAGVSEAWVKERLTQRGRHKGLYGTPLHFACMRETKTAKQEAKQTRIVELLLQHGAALSPARAEVEGMFTVTPMELAETNGNKHLKGLLESESINRRRRREIMGSQLKELQAYHPSLRMVDEEIWNFGPGAMQPLGVSPLVAQLPPKSQGTILEKYDSDTNSDSESTNESDVLWEDEIDMERQERFVEDF